MCLLSDQHGTLLYVSPSCRTTLGYAPEDLVGTAYADLIHPDDLVQLDEMSATARDGSAPASGILRTRASSGTYIWTETTGSAVRAPETGGLIGFETVARDVTVRRARDDERERLLAHVQATNQELGTALRLERNMTKELEALGLLKDEFVSTVSHELRTPLASIVGYAEVLEDGDLAGLGEDEHQMLRTIDQNGHRLLVLVEDLLTIGQIESGTFGSIQRAVDLGALLEACRNSVLPDAKSKGIHLGLSVGPGVGTIIADPVQLDRLVLNLLTNALKFTPRSGHVEIAARLEAGAAVIEVCDDGVGIPLADQGEVFSRFFRSRRSFEDAVPGIGIGLAISKSIVDEHDGCISLTSAPGAGTTVTVALPCCGGDQHAHADLRRHHSRSSHAE